MKMPNTRKETMRSKEEKEKEQKKISEKVRKKRQSMQRHAQAVI
jgi:hypothetical protein